MEDGRKPIYVVILLFFFVFLTLKDTSLLMSQKALNNTSDQYMQYLP